MPVRREKKRKHFSAWLQEVLELLAEGCTYREAAGRLHISYEGFHSRCRRIMKFLNAKNITHACCIAMRKGLI